MRKQSVQDSPAKGEGGCRFAERGKRGGGGGGGGGGVVWGGGGGGWWERHITVDFREGERRPGESWCAQRKMRKMEFFLLEEKRGCRVAQCRKGRKEKTRTLRKLTKRSNELLRSGEGKKGGFLDCYPS